MTDDKPGTDDLKHVSTAVADANAAAAKAVSRSVDVPTTPAPVGCLWNTHDALCEALRETRRALVQTDRMLRQYAHSKATPKEITSEHADRLEETYDGPVLNLALMLLEFNRRKWLYERPKANGAESVERHGLTGNQRRWLNDLQESWRAHDEVYDPRTIEHDGLSSHLQTVVTEGRNQNWGNVRMNLEAALEAAEGLEEADNDE